LNAAALKQMSLLEKTKSSARQCTAPVGLKYKYKPFCFTNMFHILVSLKATDFKITTQRRGADYLTMKIAVLILTAKIEEYA